MYMSPSVRFYIGRQGTEWLSIYQMICPKQTKIRPRVRSNSMQFSRNGLSHCRQLRSMTPGETIWHPLVEHLNIQNAVYIYRCEIVHSLPGVVLSIRILHRLCKVDVNMIYNAMIVYHTNVTIILNSAVIRLKF